MKIEEMEVKEGDLIEVPINITCMHTNNIGSMDLLLSYDPEVLEAIDVKKGDLTQNSNLEFKITNGTISISLIDLKGIQGSGDFIILEFKVLGKSGSASPLLINNIVFNLGFLPSTISEKNLALPPLIFLNVRFRSKFAP